LALSVWFRLKVNAYLLGVDSLDPCFSNKTAIDLQEALESHLIPGSERFTVVYADDCEMPMLSPRIWLVALR
jgi:hypothetical protein